jgi:glycine oxidase
MEQIELSNGIMPIRGQMLLYQSELPLVTHIINEGNRYLVPREDGFLLAGSVEEEAGYLCETTDESLALIRQWAEATLPILREMPVVKSWAGLRPGSYDGFPYLGLAPGTHNLYIAAGHFRSGLHLSCGTAVLMADMMLGQPAKMDLTPFRVGRG